MLIGSTLGSFVPMVWGGDLLSFTSIICGAFGGLFGIWGGYKLANI